MDRLGGLGVSLDVPGVGLLSRLGRLNIRVLKSMGVDILRPEWEGGAQSTTARWKTPWPCECYFRD